MRRGAPLALLVLLAAGDAATGARQPSTSGPAADQEAVDSWARVFCEQANRLRSDFEALAPRLAAQVDGTETPRELKRILRRYFERAARRIEAWRAQLDELGPAPVENGPALALAVDEGLAEAGDAFRDIGDLVQGLPEASPEAFFREGDEIFAGVDARFERVEDVMNLDRLDVPELDRAWQAEPACRRFERG